MSGAAGLYMMIYDTSSYLIANNDLYITPKLCRRLHFLCIVSGSILLQILLARAHLMIIQTDGSERM